MNYEDKFYADFVRTMETDVPKEEVANIVEQYIDWKLNVWPARWKKDFYKGDKCPKCGGAKLVHYAVDWEGRLDGWSICPSIWKTDCPDCKTRFVCVSNDDGDLLDHWTE